MTKRFKGLLVSAVLGFLLLSSRRGFAQVAVGVDASAVKAERGWGAGGDVRFGARFGLPRAFIVHTVILQVETIGGYRRVPLSSDATDLARLGGGGRIGFRLGFFEPFGYGHFSLAVAQGYFGYFADAGAAADYRFRTMNVGAHYTHGWLHTEHDATELDEFGLHWEVRGYWL